MPYLNADPRLVKEWCLRLQSAEGFKIGIAWHGNQAFRDNYLRSIPLTYFGKLADVPGIRLISLQRGPGAARAPVD